MLKVLNRFLVSSAFYLDILVILWLVSYFKLATMAGKREEQAGGPLGQVQHRIGRYELIYVMYMLCCDGGRVAGEC